jgi:hypothetical protein
MESTKFEIEEFIEKAIKKDFANLFIDCEKELNWLKNLRVTKNSPLKGMEWKIVGYRDFIHEFTFLLHNSIKPAGMKNADFVLTKPIMEALVQKGQVKPEVLAIYDGI